MRCLKRREVYHLDFGLMNLSKIKYGMLWSMLIFLVSETKHKAECSCIRGSSFWCYISCYALSPGVSLIQLVSVYNMKSMTIIHQLLHSKLSTEPQEADVLWNAFGTNAQIPPAERSSSSRNTACVSSCQKWPVWRRIKLLVSPLLDFLNVGIPHPGSGQSLRMGTGSGWLTHPLWMALSPRGVLVADGAMSPVFYTKDSICQDLPKAGVFSQLAPPVHYFHVIPTSNTLHLRTLLTSNGSPLTREIRYLLQRLWVVTGQGIPHCMFWEW